MLTTLYSHLCSANRKQKWKDGGPSSTKSKKMQQGSSSELRDVDQNLSKLNNLKAKDSQIKAFIQTFHTSSAQNLCLNLMSPSQDRDDVVDLVMASREVTLTQMCHPLSICSPNLVSNAGDNASTVNKIMKSTVTIVLCVAAVSIMQLGVE